MKHNTFSIRRESDDADVDYNEIDILISDNLDVIMWMGRVSLREEPEVLDGFPRQISWAMVIHFVACHSNIKQGRQTPLSIYEAMDEVYSDVIRFPQSVLSFFKELIDLLYRNGFYVFIHKGNHADNSWERGSVLISPSGFFACDHAGKLLRFVPAQENIIFEHIRSETYGFIYSPCVKHLIIPAGVRSFADGFFSHGLVQEYIEFPDTLVSIGDWSAMNVFNCASLPEVTIPEGVLNIGCYAFGGSRIKSLRLPAGFACEYARQFKEAQIQTLYVPCSIEEYESSYSYGFLLGQSRINQIIPLPKP